MRHMMLMLGLAVVLVLSVAGPRGCASRRPPIEIVPDMDRQPKLRPQAQSPLFPDGRSSRPPVEGTIARQAAWDDSPENTGRDRGTTNDVVVLPVPVTSSLLERGQERFGIHCQPCHGPLGDGRGITSRYGMIPAANFHDPRLVRMADGEWFRVITEGRNQMAAYASQVPAPDRWAIVAFLRALERSRLGSIEDIPEPLRAEWRK